jgi:hypothetical protein
MRISPGSHRPGTSTSTRTGSTAFEVEERLSRTRSSRLLNISHGEDRCFFAVARDPEDVVERRKVLAT